MKPRIKAPTSHGFSQTQALVERLSLRTVCEEAACPNISQCWSKKYATFMILGSVCTRSCRFCNVKTGRPDLLDPHEPTRVAQAVKDLGLKHVVITSVDRDDLDDGGANHFAQTIFAIKKYSPNTSIEVLTPDFLRKARSFEVIVQAKPDVFNHNLETVPRLYPHVRPGARYFQSLTLLRLVKEMDPTLFTKSGLMVGLGEEKQELYQVMDDLRSASVDFITIGQYLQPTKNHLEVKRYIPESEFNDYAVMAKGKGFLMVSSSALTRSSYLAHDHFEELKRLRPLKASDI